VSETEKKNWKNERNFMNRSQLFLAKCRDSQCLLFIHGMENEKDEESVKIEKI
jgi:hypothetical protein